MAFNRRQFLKSSALSAAAAGSAIAETAKPAAKGFHPASEAGRGIKLACSTGAWRKQGAALPAALAGVAAAGYTWVEVSGDDLWEYRDKADAFRALLAAHDLGLVTASMSGDFSARDERMKNISRAVQLARALQSLGSGILVLQSSVDPPRDAPGFHVQSSNLSEVGALVYEETGLHCAYRFRETEAADIRKIIATSDSRYTKFCYDTQYLARLGVDPVPMIHSYGARVIHIHLRDGGGAVVDALAASGYNGWVTVQQDGVKKSPEADARQSRRFLEPRVQAAIKAAGPEYAETRPAAERPAEDEHHAPRRGMLQDLVVIGAALAQPAALLRPASFTQTDKSNPIQQTTHDMHGHRGRPVTPLPPLDPNFQPLFFTADEYRDVSALADAIVPVTNTPGALAARADEYADFMLWMEPEHYDATRKQMARFREMCRERHGKNFAALSPGERLEFLTAVTGKQLSDRDRPAMQFFSTMRGHTIRGYYASPQGLIEELGYKGNTYVAEFKGCEHPEHRT